MHTPGPWKEHSHRQIGPDKGIVAEVWSAIGGDAAIQQADANVRLIAAAPEMLLALQTIASRTPHRGTVMLHEEELILITQAIAKATGQP